MYICVYDKYVHMPFRSKVMPSWTEICQNEHVQRFTTQAILGLRLLRTDVMDALSTLPRGRVEDVPQKSTGARQSQEVLKATDCARAGLFLSRGSQEGISK